MVTGGKSWPEESPAQPPLTASRPQVGDYRTTPSLPKTRSRTRWMEWTRPHPVARAGRGDQAAEVRGQRPTLRSKVEAERGRLRCVPFRLLASFFSSEKCLPLVSPSPFPSGNPPPSHDWCGARPLPGVAAGSSEADLLSGCQRPSLAQAGRKVVVANKLSSSGRNPPPALPERRSAAGGSAGSADETPAQTLFRQVDSNQSGTISFDEFASWWSRRTVATGGALDEELIGRMQQQWAELDTDGSGDLGTQGPIASHQTDFQLIVLPSWAQTAASLRC